MFKVLRELRRLDSRWQLNWKRGGEGDLSQDIITWNNGSLPDEGTIDVNIFDIIGGTAAATRRGTGKTSRRRRSTAAPSARAPSAPTSRLATRRKSLSI